MDRFKKKSILFCILALVLFALGFPSDRALAQDYTVWTTQNNVALNKVWTVKFNKEIDQSTLYSNIRIKDYNNVSIPITIAYVSSTKSVSISYSGKYIQGKTYTLYIDNNIKSKDGKSVLKNSIMMSFNTKNIYAGLPYENGLIIIKDKAYSIDYLANNSEMKNEITNNGYDVYYCYEYTGQKIKSIIGNNFIDGTKAPSITYKTMTYIDKNGSKWMYNWDDSTSEYKLILPTASVKSVISAGSTRSINFTVKSINGIDGITKYRMNHSIEIKNVGDSVLFNTGNDNEEVDFLSSDNNVVATAYFPTYYNFEQNISLNIIGNWSKGNTDGNINNNGYAAGDSDGYTYYDNTGDGEKLYRLDTTGTYNTVISNDKAQYINVLQDYIYYSNYSDHEKLYRMKKDGSGKEKLSDEMCAYVTISGDYIYYCNHLENGTIYKMRKDGKFLPSDYDANMINYLKSKSRFIIDINGNKIDPKVSSSVPTTSFIITDNNGNTHGIPFNYSFLNETAYISVVGDWIYYSDVQDKHKPYAMNINGNYKIKLSDDWANCIQLSGDWIYYTSANGTIIKARKDGSGETSNLQGQSALIEKGYYINVVGDWIFYSNAQDGGKLYKISTDGKGTKVKLTNEAVTYVSIVGDKIYYVSVGKLYTLPLTANGTEKGVVVGKQVNPYTIASMSDINFTVPYDEVNQPLSWIEDKYLPNKVPGVLSNNQQMQFSVEWDRNTVSVKNGTRTYKGNVLGYNKIVNFNLTIPSEMLNEKNTIKVYNNAGKAADSIEVYNDFNVNTNAYPPQLNIGDVVSVYDSEDAVKPMGTAIVAKDGTYNKATISKLDLDVYGQQKIWLSVTRMGKAESKRTWFMQPDQPVVVKLKYAEDEFLGVDGRDFSIDQWQACKSTNPDPSVYNIYFLQSKTPLDIKNQIPVDSLAESTANNQPAWIGSASSKADSKGIAFKKGDYDLYIVASYNTSGSADNRGQVPSVTGYISSDVSTINIEEESLPVKPTIKRQIVQGETSIKLDKAPAVGETAVLAPASMSWIRKSDSDNLFTPSSDNKYYILPPGVRINGFDEVYDASKNQYKISTNYISTMIGDGKNNSMPAPSGILESDPNYKDTEYKFYILNKTGLSPESDSAVVVDNRRPKIVENDVKVLAGDGLKIKADEDGTVYLIKSSFGSVTKEIMDYEVKNGDAASITVNKNIRTSIPTLKLENLPVEYENNNGVIESVYPQNYQLVMIDTAGNISDISGNNKIVIGLYRDNKDLDNLIKQSQDLYNTVTAVGAIEGEYYTAQAKATFYNAIQKAIEGEENNVFSQNDVIKTYGELNTALEKFKLSRLSKSSVLSPNTGAFDKSATSGVASEKTDITVNIQLNGNTLDSITRGSDVLVKGTNINDVGTDYTVSSPDGRNATVVISKNYLLKTTVPLGESDFWFNLTPSDKEVLKVNVKNTSDTLSNGSVNVTNNASGDDSITVLSVSDGATIKVYDSQDMSRAIATKTNYSGGNNANFIVPISGGFKIGVDTIFVTITEAGKTESLPLTVNVPKTLNAPDNVLLDSSGKVQWDNSNISGVQSYLVEIFKDNVKVADGEVSDPSIHTLDKTNGGTSFINIIKSDAGSYTARVTAKGDGVSYSDSVKSAPNLVPLVISRLLSVTKNIRWEGNIAKWDNVDNAQKYEVYLYKDGDYSTQIGSTITASSGVSGADFNSTIINNGAGSYYFKVKPIADPNSLFIDGNVSVSSLENKKTTGVTVATKVDNGTDSTPEKFTMTVTTGAINKGTVVITIGGVSTSITFNSSTSTVDVADAIYNEVTKSGSQFVALGYNISHTGGTNTIVFTASSNGDMPDLTATVN